MSDDELRNALQRLADPAPVRPGSRDAVLGAVERRRRRRRIGAGLSAAAGVGAVALLAGVLTGTDVLDTDRDGTAGVDEVVLGEWEEIATSPLSPRGDQVAVWTGEEMIVAGGTDQPPCPPNADCVGPSFEQRLFDGAAYDPAADRWRLIADAPQSMTFAQAVWTGTEMIVLVPYLAAQLEGDAGQPAATLAYDPAADTWRRLDEPPLAGRGEFGGGTGGQPVLWESEESGRGSDWLLDPESGAWSRLPDDPFPATFDRSYTWDGDDLIFTALLSRGVDDDGDDFYQLARLDRQSWDWTVLEETPVGFWNPTWFVTDRSLVNPTREEGQGGPEPGGVLDLATGEWRGLPPPEDVGDRLGCELPKIGVAGDWIVGGGMELISVNPDTAIFAPGCPPLHAPAVGVWTGQDLVVYGGVDSTYERNLTVGLRWTPPAPG